VTGEDDVSTVRTTFLGGAMVGLLLACAMLSAMPSALAREWGYGRGYYPGPFYELYQQPAHRRWSGARVPRPHRVAVPPDGYWGEPVAVYSPWCKQRVLRKDPYFGWVWTTAWAC
jgi:hypothetical protein